MDTSGARDRVDQFLFEFEVAWAAFTARNTGGGMLDFDAWGKAVGEVERRHFVEGASSGASGSYGSEPEFSPRFETVTAVTEAADSDGTVVVETTVQSGHLTSYHLFSLVRQAEGAWLIAEVQSTGQPAGVPLMEADESSALLARCQPAPRTPALASEVDGGRLFSHGTVHEIRNEYEHLVDTISVKSIGTLACAPGALSVHDFGWVNFDLEPLAWRLDAIEAEVEVAQVHGRNAAVRVRWGATPVAWLHAERVGGGHVVGSDAGNSAIFSFAALAAADSRTIDLVYYRSFAASEDRPFAQILNVDGVPVVVVDSGWGDGGYPVYWGVDTDGAVCELMVDFLVME